MKLGEIINKIAHKFNIHLIRYYPRPMIRFGLYHKILNKKDLIGVEIGVLTGEHAKNLMQTLNINKLYLIDAYTNYSGFNAEAEIDGGENPNMLSKCERLANKRMNKFKDKIVFIK